MNTVRMMNDRSDAQLKADLQHEIADIRKAVSENALDVDAGQDVKINAITLEMKQLAEMVALSETSLKNLVVENRDKGLQKFTEGVNDIQGKFDTMYEWTHQKLYETHNQVESVRLELTTEVDTRERSMGHLQTELASEHLQREKDEAQIIQMLEAFMFQISSLSKWDVQVM